MVALWTEDEAAAAAIWWLGGLAKDAVAVEDATRVAIAVLRFGFLIRGIKVRWNILVRSCGTMRRWW